MRIDEKANLLRNLPQLCILSVLAMTIGAAAARAQPTPENGYYARTNTFGIISAYSVDSSHILLGDAENRMLLNFGVSYSRRLLLNRIVNWQYNGELLPVALESEPVVHYINIQTSPAPMTYISNTTQVEACVAKSGSYDDTITFNGGSITYIGTWTQTCERRWTNGEAMSPVGLQWNFLPRHKMQPFFIGHGGYMYSTQPIPLMTAGSFNFTFDFGTGLELYRSQTRSIRAEYRYHHISNHGTAGDNPGIDNGLFQVTYSFGR